VRCDSYDVGSNVFQLCPQLYDHTMIYDRMIMKMNNNSTVYKYITQIWADHDVIISDMSLTNAFSNEN